MAGSGDLVAVKVNHDARIRALKVSILGLATIAALAPTPEEQGEVQALES